MNDITDLLSTVQKKASRSTEKLTLNTAEVTQAAALFISNDRAAKAADTAAEAQKAILLPLVRRSWLEQNHTRTEPVASVVIPVGEDGLQVSFSESWNPKGTAMEKLPADLIRKKFDITIKGDDMPDSVARDFVSRLLGVAQELGVMSAVSAKVVTVPIAAFGTLRHQKLTPEANIALEEAGLSTRVAFKAI